ncbi:MAG: DUF2892 domain-containing protein [Myxococcota bacterium]
MTKNLGNLDRSLRILAGSGLLLAAVMAPLPLWIRAALIAPNGLYFLASALAGTCLGYRLIGLNSCPQPRRS